MEYPITLYSCSCAAYADDYAHFTGGLIYESILDKFYELISPYASLIPYMFSVGNHVNKYLQYNIC